MQQMLCSDVFSLSFFHEPESHISGAAFLLVIVYNVIVITKCLNFVAGFSDCEYGYGNSDFEEEVYIFKIPFCAYDNTWNLYLHCCIREGCGK